MTSGEPIGRTALDKIIGRWPGPNRKRHRFVSEADEPPRLWDHLPRSLITFAGVKLFRRYKRGLPWLPYAAIEWIEQHIDKQTRVLEFGAGNSSIFFARRVHSVTSVEASAEWCSRVEEELREEGLNNVRIITVLPTDVLAKIQDGSIPVAEHDFVLLDATPREVILEPIISRLGAKSFLAVDNWDRYHYAEFRQRGCPKPEIEFTDFAPYNFSVSSLAIFRDQGESRTQ